MGEARAQLLDLRDRARYVLARHGHERQLAPYLIGVAARSRSIERTLELEARLAIEEVEHQALVSVHGEDGDRLARRRGELAAERVRLKARVRAETRAFATTVRLLAIRMAAVQ